MRFKTNIIYCIFSIKEDGIFLFKSTYLYSFIPNIKEHLQGFSLHIDLDIHFPFIHLKKVAIYSFSFWGHIRTPMIISRSLDYSKLSCRYQNFIFIIIKHCTLYVCHVFVRLILFCIAVSKTIVLLILVLYEYDKYGVCV